MDHMRILRRAFDITRAYRALWVFGILLALTAAHGGSSGGGGGGNGGNNQGNIPWRNFPPFQFPQIPGQVMNMMIGIGIGLICLIHPPGRDLHHRALCLQYRLNWDGQPV